MTDLPDMIRYIERACNGTWTAMMLCCMAALAAFGRPGVEYLALVLMALIGYPFVWLVVHPVAHFVYLCKTRAHDD